jgi:hypothetical protein
MDRLVPLYVRDEVRSFRSFRYGVGLRGEQEILIISFPVQSAESIAFPSSVARYLSSNLAIEIKEGTLLQERLREGGDAIRSIDRSDP